MKPTKAHLPLSKGICREFNLSNPMGRTLFWQTIVKSFCIGFLARCCSKFALIRASSRSHANLTINLVLLISLLVSSPVLAFDFDSLKTSAPYPATFNHQDAFKAAAKSLLEDKAISRKNSLTILYPGAGSHVAFLELVDQISQSQPLLQNVEIILTDLKNESFEYFLANLKLIEKSGQIKIGPIEHTLLPTESNVDNPFSANKTASVTLSKTNFSSFIKTAKASNVDSDSSEPSLNAMDLTLPNRKLRIHVRYFINAASPERDRNPLVERTFSFRKEFVDAADILISHDSSNFYSPSTLLSDFLIALSEAPTAKPRFFLMEDINSAFFLNDGEKSIDYSLISEKQILFDLPFGCRESDPNVAVEENHLGSAKYKRTILLKPDQNFFKLLSPVQILALELLALSNPTGISESGPLLHSGYFHIMWANIPNFKVPVVTALHEMLSPNSPLKPAEKERLLKKLSDFKAAYPSLATEFP